ncbi:hypothetical protein CALVIDRAFT_391299 [Calocera viscosa TUFC12733]|uniref:Uncharacterized protein n=1 Tax=Calocera viscosa (strain TUFC12733) TaxID=1330018 RepID=A0A167GHA9_CALVF|nr:hypothetical protein CALVIDRAFT_391299 [Calocera viscosa TUFC12733]
MEKTIIDNWGNASSSVLKEFNANRVSLGHTTFKKADLNKVLAGKPDPVVLRGKPKSVGHPSIAVLEDDDDDVTAPASPLDQDGSGMSEDDTGMVDEEDEGSRTHERGRPMESVIEDFTEYFSLNDVTDLGESDSESDNESTENRLSPAVPPAPETMNESDEDSTDHDGLFRSRLLGRSSIRLTNAWLSPDTM